MRKSMIIALTIILISFATAVYFYPRMPETMASHWNANGTVDGYMPRFWGLFLMPIVSIAMLLMFLLIPKIDPLKANIEKFRRYFDLFIALLIIFLFYIYLLSLSWNLGFRFDMTKMIIPALGIVFYYAGILTENAKRNWFIGIRTPWTLSNEQVWNKTNKAGGLLFKISGVIAVLGIFLQDYGIILVIVPILLASVYLIVYSYFEYQKLAKKAGRRKL